MRIVFASLGTLGDLNPVLALALCARVRGHDVRVAASVRLRGAVEAHGIPFSALRPVLHPQEDRIRHLNDPAKGPERLLREEVFPAVRETFDDLLAAAQGADLLVVGELVYVAPLVAARLGIPWVNLILAPSSFLSALDPCVMAPLPGFHKLRHLGPWPHRLLLGFGSWLTSRWAQPLYRFRREMGFPAGPNPVFRGKHSPHLTLTLFPSFFAAPQADWPARVVQTGFPFLDQKKNADVEARVERFLAAGSAPVVFTLGSSMIHIAEAFYEWAARATQRLGRRAILLVGRAPHDRYLGDVLAFEYAPLESVVRGAALLVHHGGIGSCAMALRFGVPSLVIPFGYDQPDNGERLRRRDLGRTLSRERLTVDTLTEALSEVLNHPLLAVRAREASLRIFPQRDLDDSVAALEDLVLHNP